MRLSFDDFIGTEDLDVIRGGRVLQRGLGAYTLWGLDPFRRFQGQRSLLIQVLILNEPLLQRIMASVVVNAERIPGANMEGAQALQRYLLAPATQARIRAFRYPGVEQQVWWPAGGHNIPPER